MPGVSPQDQAKVALRAEMRRLRQTLATESPQAGEDIAETAAERIMATATARGWSAPVVAGYHPLRGEFNPLPLMLALWSGGMTLALPEVVASAQPLLFRRWQPGDPLAVGAFDTRHPLPGSPKVTPTILLVPLLAFDRQGFRLGYGGGFYDRTLAGLRQQTAGLLTIGMAFAGQELAGVPHQDHDEPLDWIVTETAVHVCRDGM